MTHYLFAIEWRGSMNRKSLRIFHEFDEVLEHIHSDEVVKGSLVAKSVYSGFYRVYEITDSDSKNINKQINTLLGIDHDVSMEVIRSNSLPDNEYTFLMKKEPEDA